MTQNDEQWSTWAVAIDGKTVRLDDLSCGFWEKISEQLMKLDGPGYGTILVKPMTFPDIARQIAVEAARLLGNADPEAKIDELTASPFGEPSLKNVGNLLVMAEDDLPSVMKTPKGSDIAVPPSGDDPSTSG